MASAASPPSWVILGSVPRVLSPAAADTDLPPGVADFSLALPAPPRVALLTIRARIYPDRASSRRSPTIIAADPSGLILLHSEQGRRATPGPTITDTPGHQGVSWCPYLDAYFLLDATAPATAAFPLPNPELLSGPGFIGLITSPKGYMVAELQPVFGSAKAQLLRFSSQVGEWVTQSVAYPLPRRSWRRADGVLSCSGRLWWVDLAWCLLTCNPFAYDPTLTVVHLPEGKVLKPREAAGLLDKYRCVGVSAGKLRFVDMYRNRSSRSGAAQISVWTLDDHPVGSWTLECEATFTEICNDPSYKATGLPRKIPVLALIHPTNPDVVYFFLDGHLFGVDVRARKVVHCELYDLVEPSMEKVASRFVQAWQLPPALCSGSAKETDDGVDEELQRLHLRDEHEEREAGLT
ncbi:uncharacterized protein [Lolium perenne]|uniref:uncharacterized protein n=1 Tax=Lolium perenne TaxID=4522 RepID=UPI0021EAB874|nr:uncharacterized protein LOC127341293 [Lolium perenne]